MMVFEQGSSNAGWVPASRFPPAEVSPLSLASRGLLFFRLIRNSWQKAILKPAQDREHTSPRLYRINSRRPGMTATARRGMATPGPGTFQVAPHLRLA